LDRTYITDNVLQAKENIEYLKEKSGAHDILIKRIMIHFGWMKEGE